MKRFWLVLLSLGLVMAFSMTALAVTPDFTGQYYARGSFIKNPTMLDQDAANSRASFSYYDQRLRIFFRLKIVDGVRFTTRMDAMEGAWGADPVMYSTTSSNKYKDSWQSSLSFEQSYVTFDTAIGQFDVGQKSGIPYGWGTAFMNAPGTAPGVKWSNKFGNLSVLAGFAKTWKGDLLSTAKPGLLQTDVDSDYYDLGATYKFKGGEAGLLLTYFRDASMRSQTAANSELATVYNFQPYV
jgi:hypothetical protein